MSEDPADEKKSLADRMRRLGDQDADPAEEEAAVHRAMKAKASLAERLKDMEDIFHLEDEEEAAEGLDSEIDVEVPDEVPASAEPTVPRVPEPEMEPEPEVETESEPEPEPELEQVTAPTQAIETPPASQFESEPSAPTEEPQDEITPKEEDATPAQSPPIIAASSEPVPDGPAEETTQEIAEALTGLMGRIRKPSSEAAEREWHRQHDEPDESVAPASRMKKWSDWFLGRFEQPKEKGAVTPIPPLAEGWEELDFQEVNPPFSFTRLRRHAESGRQLYEVIEPVLSKKEARILEFIEDALVRGLNVDPAQLDKSDRSEILQRAVRQIVHDYRIRVSDVGQQRIQYFIERDFIGLGPIEALMSDPLIEDISCDGPAQGLFLFHRDLESIPCNVKFPTDDDLDAFVIRLAQRSGKSISISDPILDAALPDGSRLQATLGKEVTQNGSTFTIRRFREVPFTPVDLVRFGSMSNQLLAYFWLLVENGSSIIFSGGTASGKTTGLNAISQFIPPQSKIVSIEDTREVNLPHKNWIKSVTRAGSSSEGTGEIGMFELLRAALRQRPEYILVGEVRGIEASVAFQAMATGHTVYSTMHADSARSVVYRLENDPINVPRLVLQALDVIAIQSQVRYKDQRVRRVHEVVELVGMDPETRELLTHTAFQWHAVDDSFSFAGRSYLLETIAQRKNWAVEKIDDEMANRALIIDWMLQTGIETMEEVTGIIQSYYRNPDAVMNRIADSGFKSSAPALESDAPTPAPAVPPPVAPPPITTTNIEAPAPVVVPPPLGESGEFDASVAPELDPETPALVAAVEKEEAKEAAKILGEEDQSDES